MARRRRGTCSTIPARVRAPRGRQYRLTGVFCSRLPLASGDAIPLHSTTREAMTDAGVSSDDAWSAKKPEHTVRLG